MLRAPSLQKEYDDYVSLDPAFEQLPDPPGASASDAEREAYAKLEAEHVRKWTVARETGDFIPLLAPSKTLSEATKFVMRVIPGSKFRPLVDLQGSGRMGQAEFWAIVFRTAVHGIVNGPQGMESIKQVKPELASIQSLGSLAPSSVVDALDSLDLRIVPELAVSAWSRSMTISPRG